MELPRKRISLLLLLALLVHLALAAGKLFLGCRLGSLAVLADGLFSALNGAGGVIGLVTFCEAPDKRGKFGLVAALLLGGLLLLAGWEVLGGAAQRLLHPGAMPVYSLGGILLLLAMLAGSVALGHYERMLWLTTGLAMAGLCSAKLGWQWLDAVAAGLIVAVLAMGVCVLVGERVNRLFV